MSPGETDPRLLRAVKLLRLMRVRVVLEVEEISTDRPLDTELRAEAAALQEWIRQTDEVISSVEVPDGD